MVGLALANQQFFRHEDGPALSSLIRLSVKGTPTRIFRSPPGISGRPQRVLALGNAVMPDMARLVGQCIVRREARMAALMQSSSDGSERGGLLR